MSGGKVSECFLTPFLDWGKSDPLNPFNCVGDGSKVQKHVGPDSYLEIFNNFYSQPGDVYLYPGNKGRDDNFGAVRFTAPANGVYSIDCRVTNYRNGPASGDTDFHVVKNGVELFAAQLPPNTKHYANYSGYNNNLELAAGETVDFLSGRGLDDLLAGSGLRITLSITTIIATNSPASIFMQPTNQAVTVSSTFRFSVEAEGAGSLWYQWYFNSNVIANATNTSYSNTATNTAQSGFYHVIVTNSFGSVTSRVAALNVYTTNVFDLSTDFSTSNNPNGVWTFGWKSNETDPVVPYPFGSTVSREGAAFFVWARSPNLPSLIEKNLADHGVFLVSGFGEGVVLPGEVLLLPGNDGSDDNFGLIRFTAPSNGVYSIICDVKASAPFGDSEFHMVKGGSVLLNAQIQANGSGYTNTLALAAGEALDFLAGRGLDGHSGGSALKIKLTITAAPLIDTTPRILSPPANQFVPLGSNATFTVTASGAPVLYHHWLFNGSIIAGATGPTNTFAATNLNQSGSYQVVITNTFGSVTSSVAELQVVAEVVRPIISVAAPAANVRLTNATVLAKGASGDNSKTIKKVLYQLNGDSWLPAAGTTNWSVLLNLVPGTNTFRVYSVDSSGNTSLTNSRSVFRVVNSVLTIAATGAGSGQVNLNLNGKPLEVGRGYSVTATPMSNSVFGGWTTNNGSRLFLSLNLTFLMSSNLVLHPIFSAENPFVGGKGLYQGLFSESNNVQHASSGLLSFQLADKGAVSGKVMIAGGVHQFQGRMSLDGHTAFEISRPGKTALVIALVADLNQGTSGLFSGTVTDGNWTSELLGGRAAIAAGQFNGGLAGRYTLAIQGSISGTNEDTNFPGGISVGTSSVGPAGLIQFAGTLADGTPVTQGVNVNKDGRWPLYIPLYNGKGSLLAWVTLNAAEQRNLSGDVNWIKPAITGTRYYPSGFNEPLALSGSGYVRRATGQRVINLTLGVLTLTGGNLVDQIIESLIIGSDNTVAISGVSRPTMTVNLDTGGFNGTFVHPVTRQTTAFKGVFIQNETTAVGYFLGPFRSGAVVVETLTGPPH